MNGYIIVFDYHGDRRFWSGKKWVADPSDAEEYTTEEAGLRAFRNIEARANLRDNEACLVCRYGYADENPIRWSQSA